jgi:hypothetical protein
VGRPAPSSTTTDASAPRSWSERRCESRFITSVSVRNLFIAAPLVVVLKIGRMGVSAHRETARFAPRMAGRSMALS